MKFNCINHTKFSILIFYNSFVIDVNLKYLS
jgi:hypothetical protein